MMQTAIIIIPMICLAAILYTYLYLWHSIDSIKDSLENIRYKCDNASEIKTTEYVLHDCINKSHKELLTEIACLATKNNEDITMGRVEENSEAIAPIIRAVSSPYVIGSVRSKEFELSLLCDISKSLAVIADKMTEEKEHDQLS